MGFLNETGGNLRATWRNLSIAARWGLVLAAAAIVATSFWWSRRSPEISHVALFPGHTLAPSELVAMEAAFGRARLNGARLVDGHFEVPAERKDDYVRALIDNQALPATPASFSERLIAQDNLFTSPRQRDALMKLAKEREIALMVRQIAGISEATVHYEDVDGDGFPRRKSRRATVAVRTRSERPLAPQLVHAIRTTVANSLGITSADAIAVLDLNEGIAYTDSATSGSPSTLSPSTGNSPHVSPEQRSTPGAPTRQNLPESQTGERSTERTGPIQLATFEEPPANADSAAHATSARRVKRSAGTTSPTSLPPPRNVQMRDDQPHNFPTHNSATQNSATSGPAVEQVAKPRAESDKEPTGEPAEPRLLPKSILRMVRPASHEEHDTDERASGADQLRRGGRDTNASGAKGASDAKDAKDARDARDAKGATKPQLSRTTEPSAPARAAAPPARSDDRSTRWSIWLRDHGPTVGGCGAGLGMLMWLLRALLTARRDARERNSRTAPETHVERFEPRDDHASAQRAAGQATDSTDVRRELADRVRADTSTAAAKLRQWLGHAA